MLFQPALLYIVPLCLIVPLTVALILGDIKSMFNYRDHEEMDPNASKTSENINTSASEVSGSEQTASAPSSPVAAAGKKGSKKTQ